MNIQRIKAAGHAGGEEHRVLGDLAAMDAAGDAWVALAARSGERLAYFQEFDWCRQWVAMFAEGDSGTRPVVHTLWRGDRLVAVWPLMLTGGGRGLARLQPLGVPHTQYANILIDPDYDAKDRSALGRRLVAVLRQEGGFDLALFGTVPEGSALSTALSDIAPMSGVDNEASMLDLSAFPSSEAYGAALSKTQRRNRNRRRNQLARAGELSFSVLWPDDPQFGPTVLECARMKRRWLRETGRVSSGFGYDGFDRFLASLGGNENALSGACVFALKAGDRLVAAEIGLISHGHYYAYLGAFDWDLRDASPGKTQMDMTVSWLIDKGISAYDLLGNPADYKESWSNRDIRLDTYAIPASWKGRLYADLWVARLRPALKRIYSSMPYRLRKLAQVGQSIGLFVILA